MHPSAPFPTYNLAPSLRDSQSWSTHPKPYQYVITLSAPCAPFPLMLDTLKMENSNRIPFLLLFLDNKQFLLINGHVTNGCKYRLGLILDFGLILDSFLGLWDNVSSKCFIPSFPILSPGISPTPTDTPPNP